MKKMRLWSLILFIGICSPHWTIATLYSFRDYIIDLDGNILKGMTVIPYHRSTKIDLSDAQTPHYEESVFDNVTDARILDLSKNGIEHLPLRIFSKMENLQQLSLANNGFSHVAGLFSELSNLTRLDLSNNRIARIQSGDLFGLQNFTDIIIGGNEFESISSRAFQNKSAKALDFDSDYQAYYELADEDGLADVPLHNDFEVKICKIGDGIVESVEQLRENEALGKCIKATIDRQRRSLDLSNLGLWKFERGWYKLPPHAINKIDLSMNKINDITSELLNDLPMGLSTVDLTYNRLSMIKKDVIENRFLKKLIFDYNYIMKIEDDAFKNTNLVSIHAKTNNLDSLAFVKTLPRSIEELSIIFNRITEISGDTFRGLINLKMINLSHNFLKKIEPGLFADQKNLRELRMANNNITAVPSGLCRGLQKIIKIDFSHNDIKKISRDTFSELRNSKDLEIDLLDNKIDNIEGGSFSNLHLFSLDLSVNKITGNSIDKNAFQSCDLRSLSLGSNYITRINSELFRGISGSYKLNLAGNQISTINKGDARYLGNVSKLILDHNPLEHLQNGALYGISQDKDVEISLYTVPIKVIQSGLFKNFENKV